jgi:hypothetical protein
VVGARGIRTSDLLLPKQAGDIRGVKMTDEELARQVWNRVCEAAEYAKNAGITGTALYALMGNTCLKETEAAFAAIREECAKELPTNWLDPLLTGPKAVVGQPPYGCPDIERLCKAIAERIRTAQPAGKAQEGA